MIEINALRRSYNGAAALDGIDMNIRKGSFTVILGRNGSGKSTFARHLNALLIPQSGAVAVDGIDTRERRRVFDVRERVGMVFQNPESQAAATIVEDDTAFAPENLGLDAEEIERRVEFALDAAGISKLRRRGISTLSGGQKQLTAIAGALALLPEYLVFDEATSMLDPSARTRIVDCAKRLRSERGTGIIWITHNMEEAAGADRVIILDEGRIAADGTPSEMFSEYELILRSGLELPQCAALCLALKRGGLPLPALPADTESCADMLFRLIGKRSAAKVAAEDRLAAGVRAELNGVSYSYPGSSRPALSDITLRITSGITAVIGRAGSGKSTLCEMVAGITEPDAGEALIDGSPASRRPPRAGMVFQYPESQLFAETALEDIAFAPRNFGLSEEEALRRAREAAELVGLSEAELKKSPFALSGGRRRLAAIAGILAMKPSLLVLDEPAAGLDPAGRERLFSVLTALKADDPDMAIVFVTHSMEDAARYADSVTALKDGRIAARGTPREILSDERLLTELGMEPPQMPRLAAALRERGADIGLPLTVSEAAETILELMRGGGADAS